jgi:hypothetical protein
MYVSNKIQFDSAAVCCCIIHIPHTTEDSKRNTPQIPLISVLYANTSVVVILDHQ